MRLPVHRFAPEVLSFPEYERGIVTDRFGLPEDRIPSVFIVQLSEEIGWPAILVGGAVAIELALPWLDVVGEHIGYPWPENRGDARQRVFIGKPLEPVPEYAVWLWTRYILDRRWIPGEAEYGLRGPSRLRDELHMPAEAAYLPFSEENEAAYLNYYYCPECETDWTDVWTAMSDDTCPECGLRNIQPERSEEFYEAGDPVDALGDTVREFVRGVARSVNEIFAIHDELLDPEANRELWISRATFQLDQAVQQLGAIGAALGYHPQWLTQQWMEEVKRRLPIARGQLVGRRTLGSPQPYESFQRQLTPRRETWGEETWPVVSAEEAEERPDFISPAEFNSLVPADYLPVGLFTMRLVRDLDQVAHDPRRWPPFASQVLEVVADTLRLPPQRREPALRQLLADVRSVPDDERTDVLRDAIAGMLENAMDPEINRFQSERALVDRRFEPFHQMTTWGIEGVPSSWVDQFVDVWERTVWPRLAVSPRPPVQNAVNIFQDLRGDGTHRGVSDFYDRTREALLEALSQGDDFYWTTGWFSSKHEIASGQVTHMPNGDVIVDVHVWNDFDDRGAGRVDDLNVSGFTPEFALDNIAAALDAAWAEAQQDLRENASADLYAVGRPVIREGATEPSPPRWEYTYLVDRFGLETPPGDSYFRWGWTDVEDDSELDEVIPPAVREALEEGMLAGEERVEAGEWIAQLAAN